MLFDVQWCRELLDRVLCRLAAGYHQKDKAALFAALRPVLVSGGSLRGHDAAALAASLSMKPGALRAALLRMLRDYRALLVEEVRHTVDSRGDVEAEIANLMQVLGGT